MQATAPPLRLVRSISLPRVSGLVAFRWLVVGCQAATCLITWPLWQVHRQPPMLPALPLPQFDLGPLMLGSLGLSLLAPLPGIASHTVLVFYAVLIDQTRLQPEIVSHVFLLWASLPFAEAKALGRAHLISLWLFAGLNKLLSPLFMHGLAQWMLDGLLPNAPSLLRDQAGYLIALSEMGTGALALFPRTRRLAAAMAFGLHAGILLDLHALGYGWNKAVWPWNVGLALAGFALIAPWKEAPLATLLQCRRLTRPLLILLIVSPLGFYFALTDANLAHHMYTGSIPSTTWCDARGRCVPGRETAETFRAFNVPLPAEHRLFEAYFAQTCRRGERMTIHDPRWWASTRGFDERELTCR